MSIPRADARRQGPQGTGARGRGGKRWYDSRRPYAYDGPIVRSVLMAPDPPPRRPWLLWLLLVLLTLLLVLLGVGILDWFEL
jgi:hypothetical protein